MKMWLLAVPNRAAEVAESYLQRAGLEYIRYSETGPYDTEPVLELEDGRIFEGLRAINEFCNRETAIKGAESH
ncbi:MAG: hypothetical protein WC553_00865 [Patescibacteria group bacterium]|jgi:hypothetical protein